MKPRFRHGEKVKTNDYPETPVFAGVVTKKPNTMKTLAQLRKVKTIQDLEALKIGNIICNISHRGGSVGFYSIDVAREFVVPPQFLPPKFGAVCNYLGGGVRGATFHSNFDEEIPENKAKLLNALGDACIRAYESAERECGFITDDPEDWNSKATKVSRKSGIISAY